MSIEKQSRAVGQMLSLSQRIIDVSEGAHIIRAKASTYLPKFEKEHDIDYEGRVKNTYVFDGVGKTIEEMTGKVFENPAKVEAPSLNDEWIENVDRLGNSVSAFAMDVFKEAQKTGISFILTDATSRPSGEITAGEAQKMGLRPYLVHIKLSSVLGWKFAEINGSPTLVQFRIMEMVEAEDEDNPYEPKLIEQVRMFELPHDVDEFGMARKKGMVTCATYRKTKDGGFVQYGDLMQTGLDEISISAVNINEQGLFVAKPVYDRLAEINMGLIRLQSDHDWCQHKSLSPVWFQKGAGVSEESEENGTVEIGSSFGVVSDSEYADAKWVEVSGAGLSAAREEIEKRKKEMQSVGLQIATERAATATGDIIDDKKATTRLGMWASILEQAMTRSLMFMQEYAGTTGEVLFEVNKDFASTMLAHLDMQVLRDMFRDGVLSRETYLREAKRRGKISANIEVEDEIARIEAEITLDEPVTEE